MFCVVGGQKANQYSYKQKTSPQSCKPQIKIVAYPGLAQSGFEQAGPGAPVLDFHLMKA